MREVFGTEVKWKEEKACGIYGKDFIVAVANTVFWKWLCDAGREKNGFILNDLLLVFALAVWVIQYQIKCMIEVNV